MSEAKITNGRRRRLAGRISRRRLAALLERPGGDVHLQTRSDRILGDLDLLRELDATGRLTVEIVLPGLDTGLVGKLEPGAPPPMQRLAAVRRLRREGIDAGVLLSPILPGLTDRCGQLERAVRAASRAGAMWLGAEGLTLPPAARAVFFRLLREVRPELLPVYRRRFNPDGSPPVLWIERVLSIVAAFRARAGLPEAPPEREPGDQLRLPFAGAAVAGNIGVAVS
jgi:DNA repair photolyase